MGFPGAGGGSGASADTRYADGGYEFEEGGDVFVGRRAGCWIYGWAALRLLCHLNGYEAPRRRMKWEPFRPVPELIVVALAEQLAVDRHTLGVHSVRSGRGQRYDPADPYAHLTEQAAAFWRRLERIHREERIDFPSSVDRRRTSSPLRTDWS